MRYFDLHCDTLYRAVNESKYLDSKDFELSFNSARELFDTWKQCTAIWIPDEFSTKEAQALFEIASAKLTDDARRLLMPINDFDAEQSLIFTVENAKLISDVNYIAHLKSRGVRMITLTWNAENNIGGGALAQGTGLTPFGHKCIRELENHDIVIDISHASDRLFYDVAEASKKPFVASHSNSRTVCNNMRNITDDQFSVIVNRGGLVGLNFHKNFLSEKPEKSSLMDVLRHAHYFLSLGGENTLAIGSDFDGADIPDDLNSSTKIAILAETFIKSGINEQIVQKIMYDNAHNFFSKF